MAQGPSHWHTILSVASDTGQGLAFPKAARAASLNSIAMAGTLRFIISGRGPQSRAARFKSDAMDSRDLLAVTELYQMVFSPLAARSFSLTSEGNDPRVSRIIHPRRT